MVRLRVYQYKISAIVTMTWLTRSFILPFCQSTSLMCWWDVLLFLPMVLNILVWALLKEGLQKLYNTYNVCRYTLTRWEAMKHTRSIKPLVRVYHSGSIINITFFFHSISHCISAKYQLHDDWNVTLRFRFGTNRNYT